MKLSLTKNTYLTIFYFLFIFILIVHFFESLIHGYSKDSWQISEFLINYRGGFVRRGLLGEIILNLYENFGLNPYFTILILCISAYLGLIIFFVKSFIKNGYTLFVLPFVYFLGNPIINYFWVRKDILIILIFISIIYFSIKKSNLSLIFVNLFFILGLLIHESIAFFGFPILLLILINKNNKFYSTNFSIKSVFISIFQLLPSIFGFLCVLYFKGSQIISGKIWDSWSSVDFPLQPMNDNLIPAAIAGLSWSLNKGLLFTVNTLKNFKNDIYAPMAWFFILLIIYYLLTNTDKLNFKILKYKPFRNINKINISNILIFQLFTIVPLFILGWDYGRWVFFWITSSFAIIILVPENELLILFPKLLNYFSKNINKNLDSILSRSTGFLFLISLIIGFPQYSWNLLTCVYNNSLVIVLQFISGYLEKILPIIF